MGHFHGLQVGKLGHQVGPFVWPQATRGPERLVSYLLPGPTMSVESSSSAPMRNSSFPSDVAPAPHVQRVPQVHVTLTRQQRFDQAMMNAAHGVTCCLTIACQGLQEQHNEPFNEDNLVAAYTLGRHFANNMRVPMQDCSDLLMCCTPFGSEVPYNHRGCLHAPVRVVDNA